MVLNLGRESCKEQRCIKSIEKNGDVCKAPEWFCGCEHHSMLEMKPLTKDYIEYYTKSQNMAMYGLKCANKGCTHGKLSVRWPRPNRMSDYGYYCLYVLREEWKKNGEKVCDFLICNDCAPARFDKENKVKAMANGGSNNRRSARKKRK